MCINNNASFCYWNRWKLLSANIFWGMQIFTKKIKFDNHIIEEVDSDSKDESKSNSDNDNDSDGE